VQQITPRRNVRYFLTAKPLLLPSFSSPPFSLPSALNENEREREGMLKRSLGSYPRELGVKESDSTCASRRKKISPFAGKIYSTQKCIFSLKRAPFQSTSVHLLPMFADKLCRCRAFAKWPSFLVWRKSSALEASRKNARKRNHFPTISRRIYSRVFEAHTCGSQPELRFSGHIHTRGRICSHELQFRCTFYPFFRYASVGSEFGRGWRKIK